MEHGQGQQKDTACCQNGPQQKIELLIGRKKVICLTSQLTPLTSVAPSCH